VTEDNALFQTKAEAAVKARLGEAAFEKAWALGQSMPEQALLSAKSVTH